MFNISLDSVSIPRTSSKENAISSRKSLKLPRDQIELRKLNISLKDLARGLEGNETDVIKSIQEKAYDLRDKSELMMHYCLFKQAERISKLYLSLNDEIHFGEMNRLNSSADAQPATTLFFKENPHLQSLLNLYNEIAGSKVVDANFHSDSLKNLAETIELEKVFQDIRSQKDPLIKKNLASAISAKLIKKLKKLEDGQKIAFMFNQKDPVVIEIGLKKMDDQSYFHLRIFEQGKRDVKTTQFENLPLQRINSGLVEQLLSTALNENKKPNFFRRILNLLMRLFVGNPRVHDLYRRIQHNLDNGEFKVKPQVVWVKELIHHENISTLYQKVWLVKAK